MAAGDDGALLPAIFGVGQTGRRHFRSDQRRVFTGQQSRHARLDNGYLGQPTPVCRHQRGIPVVEPGGQPGQPLIINFHRGHRRQLFTQGQSGHQVPSAVVRQVAFALSSRSRGRAQYVGVSIDGYQIEAGRIPQQSSVVVATGIGNLCAVLVAVSVFDPVPGGLVPGGNDGGANRVDIFSRCV